MKGSKPSLKNVVPLREDAPRPVPGAPEFLSGEAVKIWDDLAPYLVARDRLEPHHVYQFATYCQSVANFLAATFTIDCEGMFYEVQGRNGKQQKRHPAVAVQAEAMNAMRRDSALFGLSPVDDQRMQSGGQGDLFDDLMTQLRGGTGATG
ncbi:phage terminase small subunit P27 family [Palleronia sp. LCG004]|uniref:phage terminase small subunit P27 family n=1 Tax=Palleronia sp. LCG004 TaxID=3079304 RepID=UPI0029439CD2|nr:phage terminase small subunit P27 family [Palleronia sp. LCG004]WOI54968.1 phage terminase small subunit P27 family [Palleronia sp. LCG004]